MVAFEHNKILWFIASLASLMTASICLDYYTTFFKEFRGTAEQKNLHESPALITFPNCFGNFSNISGLISLPTNSWLNEYLLLYLQSSYRGTPLWNIRISC
jgi:NADH-quinone oxidoreductase subunit L